MNRSLRNSVHQQEEQLIDCTLRCSPGPVSMVDSAAAREGSDSNSIIWSGAVAGPSVAVAVAAAGTGAASTSNEPHPSVRYKGVMLQHNGHWGAQIYAHGDRIWLGTFKSEHAAAAAYDSAAIKLHHGEYTHRNVPASPLTAHEYKFQETLTTEQVLDMIKTGSYESRLEEFIRRSAIETTGDAAAKAAAKAAAATASSPNSGGNVTFLEMFVKELTPSDVGKLNRLVIPKKHATQYFPQVSSDSTDEVLVEFVDRENRPWTFRYCYWKSSQSYVFTKGWNKFVKEKRLEAKDSVAFYRCEERDVRRRRYCMIDIIRRHNDGGREASGGFSWSKSGAMGLGLGLSFKRRNLEQEQSKISGVMGAVQLGLSFKRKMEEDEEGEVVSGPAAAAPLPQKPVMDLVLDHHNNANNKKLKLFGEWII